MRTLYALALFLFALTTCEGYLQHWWKADNDYTDAVGGDTGTPINSPTFVTGVCNQAYSVTQAANSSIHYYGSSTTMLYGGDFTIAFWLNANFPDPTNPNSPQLILINKRDQCGLESFWSFRSKNQNNAMYMEFEYYDGTNQIEMDFQLNGKFNNTWIHIAATRQGNGGNNMQVWFNGNAENSATGVYKTWGNTPHIQIGMDPCQEHSGQIEATISSFDEVMIFDNYVSPHSLYSMPCITTGGTISGITLTNTGTPGTFSWTATIPNSTYAGSISASSYTYTIEFSSSFSGPWTSVTVPGAGIQYVLDQTHQNQYMRVSQAFGAFTSAYSAVIKVPSAAGAIQHYWPFDGDYTDPPSGDTGNPWDDPVFEGAICSTGTTIMGNVSSFVNFTGSSTSMLFAGDYTISYWLKLPSGMNRGTTMALVSKREICSYDNFWDFRMDLTGSTDILQFEYYNGVTASFNIKYTVNTTTFYNTFNHIAVTRSGNVTTLYLNNQAVANTSTVVVGVIGARVRIGDDVCLGQSTVIPPYAIFDELQFYDAVVPISLLYSSPCVKAAPQVTLNGTSSPYNYTVNIFHPYARYSAQTLNYVIQGASSQDGPWSTLTTTPATSFNFGPSSTEAGGYVRVGVTFDYGSTSFSAPILIPAVPSTSSPAAGGTGANPTATTTTGSASIVEATVAWMVIALLLLAF